MINKFVTDGKNVRITIEMTTEKLQHQNIYKLTTRGIPGFTEADRKR